MFLPIEIVTIICKLLKYGDQENLIKTIYPYYDEILYDYRKKFIKNNIPIDIIECLGGIDNLTKYPYLEYIANNNETDFITHIMNNDVRENIAYGNDFNRRPYIAIKYNIIEEEKEYKYVELLYNRFPLIQLSWNSRTYLNSQIHRFYTRPFRNQEYKEKLRKIINADNCIEFNKKIILTDFLQLEQSYEEYRNK
tara:strand:- start:192 stop:776 length:585 start_codon:yes stop_codon:yes gene_type:complete